MPKTRCMDTLAARDHRRANRSTERLDSIRAELRTRLDELRPLVREYERLQHAEAALADGSRTSGKRAGQPKRGGSQARPGGDRRGGPGERLRAGARARRPNVRATARRFWRSSVSDWASPKPSSTRRGSRTPASPRICGGCPTGGSCARKRCRAVRPATGSPTTEPAARERPRRRDQLGSQPPVRRTAPGTESGARSRASQRPGEPMVSAPAAWCALLTSDS
jgi:hypothetical protein